MRGIAIVVLAGFLGGCTTVKLVQRDGCWIRQTKRTLGGSKEDLGPCTRPAPSWSEDRLTRLVQECVAQADYRWQARALAAWSRKEPLPAQPARETVIETCMNQAATGVVTQNETLRDRLAEVSNDRDALRAHAAQGDDHLRETSTKLAEYLGEAAKRPPPAATATATATSDGTATTDSGLESHTGSTSQTVPAAPAIAPVVPAATPRAATPAAEAEPAPGPGAPAVKAREQARAPRRRPKVRGADARGCDAPAAPAAGELATRPPAGDAAAPPAAPR